MSAFPLRSKLLLLLIILVFGFKLPMSCHQDVQPQFNAQTIDSTVSIGYGIALGDVDGDGKIDILLADKKQFVWYRNGDWRKFVLAENITQHDNVCIAARDMDGDGKVEVAVGGQWNPSETSNADVSGSVHYLQRPEDPTKLWAPVKLPHEPTVHRMKWVRSGNGESWLVVLPLHGRGNKGGEGAGVRVLGYRIPRNANDRWDTIVLDHQLHLTHNFDVVEAAGTHPAGIYFASKEGVHFRDLHFTTNSVSRSIPGINRSSGEIKTGKAKGLNFIATIEPMHGHQLVVYGNSVPANGILLDSNLKEGHALAVADFLGTGEDQIVAGWREPNTDGKTGIRIYYRRNPNEKHWESAWIDENRMACEDLQAADLNNDGKVDIVASGRSTRNLKIYWNNSRQK